MRRLVFLVRRAPYGTSFGREALEAILATSAFELPTTVVLDGDGVLQLVRDQDPSANGEKNAGATWEALPMFEVEDVRVHAPSLATRGLTADDLLLPVTLLDDAELAAVIAEADQVLSF